MGKLICNPSYGNRDTEFKIAAIGWFIQDRYNDMLEYKFIAREGNVETVLQEWNTNDRLETNLPVPCTLELHISNSNNHVLKAKKFIPEEVTIMDEIVDTIDVNEIKRRLPEKNINNDILIKPEELVEDFTPFIDTSLNKREKITRTKKRPLATGEISIPNAFYFLIVHYYGIQTIPLPFYRFCTDL